MSGCLFFSRERASFSEKIDFVPHVSVSVMLSVGMTLGVEKKEI